jgi:3-phosphoshikimate 1-carboxyvinyltransferase
VDDGCIIRGNGKIRGGTIETQMDHRIMMAATVAGLTSISGVVMEDEKSYEVSYPNFLDDIQRLGAIVQVVNQ